MRVPLLQGPTESQRVTIHVADEIGVGTHAKRFEIAVALGHIDADRVAGHTEVTETECLAVGTREAAGT